MNDNTPMTIPEALASLGADPKLLNEKERRSLDEQGLLMIPDALSPGQLAELRRRIDLLTQLEGSEGGKEVHQEAGAARLSNLVDKGDAFRVCFTHPKVLAAIAHVLNANFHLSSLNARAALPGQGLQALHVDWNGAVAAGDFRVCNSIWLLDDFTPENGATRAVPGSHLKSQTPSQTMPDPKASHPDEVLLLAPAGTVFIFNSHTWHGGTLNRTDKPRRALHSYFSRRDMPQQLPQQDYLSPALIRSLSPAERCILEVTMG